MLKKLPKARIEIEDDYFRKPRWVDEQQTALSDGEREQLMKEMSEKQQELVENAVYEAVKATAGEPGVHLLDSHVKRLGKLARAEAASFAAYKTSAASLATVWVDVVEREIWGAYVRPPQRSNFYFARRHRSAGEAVLPTQTSLVRLVFPEVDVDYANLRKWAFIDKYDFENFVVTNSSLNERMEGDEDDNSSLYEQMEDDEYETELQWLCRPVHLSNYFWELWEDTPPSDKNFPAYVEIHVSAKRAVRADKVTQDQLAIDGPPLQLNDSNVETFWWYQGSIYVTEEDLEPDDVLALINEKENKKRSKLNKARDLQAMRDEDNGGKPAETGKAGKKTRKSIPEEVRHAVWRRDEGKCVDCDSQQELEFDHIIPLAMGGSNTERNLQLLCADCNRRKGATLG
jgi:hypothetical protein